MSDFKQDNDETPVIFRKYGPRRGDSVIALFPAELGTPDPYTCSSYVHVGQHGSADPNRVMRRTRPATPDEYRDLQAELEGAPFGYRLRIYGRLQRSFQKARFEQLSRLHR